MIRASLYILAALLLIGGAQAAYVELSAPDRINVGETLQVQGSSLGTLRPGFSTDLILYQMLFTKKEVAREHIVVQEGGIFSASFDTTGLAAGSYLLELVDPKTDGNDVFGGTTKNIIPVTLVDRSGELTISSPMVQEFTGYLYIKGTLSRTYENGTQIKVEKAGQVIFGPEWIATRGGSFDTTVPVTAAGTYKVSFSDIHGYITATDFAVKEATTTPSTTATPTLLPEISVSGPATRTQPAYFTVDSKVGTLRIRTSSGIDWVMEYVDESGSRFTVNEKGTLGGESVTLETRGGPVYVKVYPANYTDQGTVTLYAENADAVNLCPSCAGFFTGTPSSTPTQKAPFPAAIAFLALLILAVWRR